MSDRPNATIGVEAVNAYLGSVAITVEDLFVGRSLDLERMTNIEQHERSVGLPFEDPVTNACNAARPIVASLGSAAAAIETLVVASESGIDYSKSISSYVHDQLGLSSQCRVFEVKQACYSATGILQTVAASLASGISPGAKALVIASDVALVGETALYAEPATGFGAVALLIGEQPSLLTLDLGAYGLHSYETFDSARPTPHFDVVDVDRSLFAYLDCLTSSFEQYRKAVPGASLDETFSYLCMHTPFVGLVRAAHRKLLREHGETSAAALAEDFERRVRPSLHYSTRTGNLCAGSVYLGLASVVDNRSTTDPARIGLFSYGSGCSSEFFSGVLGPGPANGSTGIQDHLDSRRMIDFDCYVALLQSNLRAIEPIESKKLDQGLWSHLLPVDRPRRLALVEISDYHRNYEWI